MSFNPGDQENRDGIAVHHSEVGLRIVDLEAQHVAIVRDPGGDVIEWQLGQGPSELPERIGSRRWLLKRLPKPQPVPVGVLVLRS